MEEVKLEAKKKLPLWKTVGRAYWAFFANPIQILKSSWLWVIAIFAISFVYEWVAWPWSSPIDARILVEDPNMTPATTIETILWWAHGLLGELLNTFFLSSLAVAWHRLILSGETIHHMYYSRLDRVVCAYAFVAIIILIFSYLPFLGFFLSPGPEDVHEEWLLWLLAATVGTVVVFVVLARITVYLPAVALQRNKVSLGTVWRTTRGNSWRLFFGAFLCTLPFILAMIGLALLMTGETRFDQSWLIATSSAVNAITLFPTVSFFSYAFQYFFAEAEVDAEVGAVPA